MNIKAVGSVKASAAEAVADIKAQLGSFDAKMVVFFASREAYAPDEIARDMQAAFPQCTVFGCSSHAELIGSKTLTNSVTAMVLNSEIISDAKVEVLENIGKCVDVQPAFDAFDAYFKTDMADVDYKEYGGIVLIDGLSLVEEEIMDKIGDKTNIMFTGGSASDAMKFESTYVYANGKAYTDAAILAVFKTKRGIDFIKTQSVEVTDTTFTITKANCEKRAIEEFDNKPAVTCYADALGVNREGVDSFFFANPLGLVIGSDVFIRSCNKSDGETLYVHCNVLENTTLNLLKIKDIIPDTKAAVKNKLKELGEISGIIDFRCAFRTIQLEIDGTTEAYGKIFENIPTIGFSTFGEAFLGHINQTSTMMVFK